ncbi:MULTISPECIES: outer membrane protein [unclassified Methylosinus]|uniref:outer membrane protein n=2 Tax=Methylosinus TaxID=425 RepID=UPI000A012402|nr:MULTISPECIES: outer membrane beta-barrel protein [unclassified Methylosinus]
MFMQSSKHRLHLAVRPHMPGRSVTHTYSHLLHREQQMTCKHRFTALVLIFCTTAADAADLPRSYFVPPPPVFVPPPPVFLFEGFYVGAQIGYARTATRLRNVFVPTGATLTSRTIHGDSLIGGLHAGYDWHSGPLVFGLIGDINFANARSSAETVFGDSVVDRVGLQGSMRGRVGYAFDRILFYATGGLFLADVSRHYYSGAFAAHRNDIVVGPTLGLGVEYALDDRWRAKIEYRVDGLPTQREYFTPISPGVKLRRESGEGEIKLGLSYRFGN